ncbi:MAG: hypothetical protein EHJ94_02445 [Deltaproteobacteria bacterium]|nr:MAG: hypothetical protein EHJ94_02445 [Deltaproteobacteria bacterium]
MTSHFSLFRKIPVYVAIFLGIASFSSADTLSLADCLKEAIKNNPAVKEGELDINAGDKSISSARLRHLPKISLDGNYTRREEPTPYIPAKAITVPAHFSDEFASWQVVMTLPLYQGGQIQNNVRIAEIKKAVTESTFRLTKDEIIANTVTTYNKLLQLRKLKKAAEASVKALEEQLDITTMMYKSGRTAHHDLIPFTQTRPACGSAQYPGNGGQFDQGRASQTS